MQLVRAGTAALPIPAIPASSRGMSSPTNARRHISVRYRSRQKTCSLNGWSRAGILAPKVMYGMYGNVAVSRLPS